MFTLKNISIYFLILLLFIGINLFKNIYIEKKINNHLEEKGMTKVNSIKCNGFLNIECKLQDISFRKKITDTNYIIKVKQVNLLDFNIFEKTKGINNFKLVVKSLTISDSRNAFVELKKPMDLNIKLINNDYIYTTMSVIHQDLELRVVLTFEDNKTLIPQNFSSIKVEIERDNDVIKKIIYELYKVKLLEIIENDDADFSETRGMNIPLGVDTHSVMSQKVFLGEPYISVSILLNSEIETFDFMMEYNKNNHISKFISDVIENNGLSKLQIRRKKENK